MALTPKPDSCLGCPLYGTGEGFVLDAKPLKYEPRLIIVRDVPSQDSADAGRAGKSGEMKLFRSRTAQSMGLDGVRDVAIMHVIRCRPWNGKDYVTQLPKADITNPAIRQCRQYDDQELLTHNPDFPKVLVANGRYAWKVCSDNAGTVNDWRGFFTQRAEDATVVSISDDDGDSGDSDDVHEHGCAELDG